MSQKTLYCAISIVALILFSSVVYAGPHHGKGNKFFTLFDSNSDNIVTLDELISSGNSRFSTMDADNNGIVNAEEFKQYRGKIKSEKRLKRFAKIDANADSTISLDEFIAYKRQKIEKRFNNIDSNGDGLISSDEFANKPRKKHYDKKRHHSGHHGGKRMFKKLDANADGEITLDEAMTAWKKWFNKLDINADGMVTREEVKSARQMTRDTKKFMK